MFCTHCGTKLEEGTKFCTNCGSPTKQERKRFPWGAIALVLVVLAGIGAAAYYTSTSEEEQGDIGSATSLLAEMEPSLEPVGRFTQPLLFDSDELSDEEWLSYIAYTQPAFLYVPEPSHPQFPGQIQAYSAVVKIVCEDEDYFYYGSGTNMDAAGYVLTNLHVIEGDAELECMVGFPDPQSGLIREVYWATPIVDAENVTGHDLAVLSVEEPVFDEEHNIYGFYEKYANGTFQYYFETDACLEVAPELGDQIFALGYPALTGGALTITDGLISSLYSADDYLITSAKISSGNSGGLALDTNGCFVGVPTAVYLEEENEQYGEIIDAYFVYEFFDAVLDDIEEYRVSNGWTSESKEELPTPSF
ncbi:MAG TPA: trypsin-like peptidase domain-containing protein [Candidatus Paceibacterota bacterium]|nr:trypsin-like peptidase domain-containing protein [Candidatus Paceibacterota bacterium]